MKIRMIFAWYDLWIGLFYDRKKHWLYLFLIPTIGIVFQFYKKRLIDIDDPKAPWNLRKDFARDKK
jgi:hypothetical protein